MTSTNSISRSLHDVGLAAWFGGALMGAVGLNGAASNVSNPSERTRVAVDGWRRWAPVNSVAIGAHLLGGYLIVKANKGRIAGQSGVALATGLKTTLTGAALLATVTSGVLGARVARQADTPATGATEASAATPEGVASAQRSLRLIQWVTPALTGLVLVVSARMGEQQRPGQIASCVLSRIRPG